MCSNYIDLSRLRCWHDWEGQCDHLQRKKILLFLISCHFFISTLVLKFEMTISVNWNCWQNETISDSIQLSKKNNLCEVGTTITMHEVKIGKWMDKAGDSRPHPKTFKHHEVHTNQIGWTNANQRQSRRLRKSLKAVIPKWTHDCLRQHNRNQSTYKWPNPVAQSLYSSPSQNSLSCCLLLQSNIIASE